MNTPSTILQRIPEPEKMTDEEEAHYARADYSVPHEALVTEVVDRLGPQSQIALVDLGTGPGDVPIRFRQKVTWELWGVDFSPAMLAYASHDAATRLDAQSLPINWVVSDIKRTGLPQRYFDVAISNSVLHHLEDPVQFWREVERISKPGSLIQVRDLRRPPSYSEAGRLTLLHVGNESEVVQQHYHSSLLSSYRVDEVQQQLEAAGLRGLEVKELSDRYLEVVGKRH